MEARVRAVLPESLNRKHPREEGTTLCSPAVSAEYLELHFESSSELPDVASHVSASPKTSAEVLSGRTLKTAPLLRSSLSWGSRPPMGYPPVSSVRNYTSLEAVSLPGTASLLLACQLRYPFFRSSSLSCYFSSLGGSRRSPFVTCARSVWTDSVRRRSHGRIT